MAVFPWSLSENGVPPIPATSFSQPFSLMKWPFKGGFKNHNLGHIQWVQGHPKVGKGSSALIYKIPLSSLLAKLTIDS